MSATDLRTDPQLEVTNPFPGLRPFDVHESEIFFGREDEIQELLSRLRRTHFLAVVGSSGCGKSSVVRAGLVASLQDGFMTEATAPWRIAIMRPGNNPVAQLALALNAREALGSTCDNPDESAAMRQAALRRGAVGLIEAYEEADLTPGSKLLLLVDQFEELFRFMRHSPGSANKLAKEGVDGKKQAAGLRRASATDDAQAFVKLLLAAAESSTAIYVVLTMRSEFLGHCANFPGLSEAISDGLYLLPQMSREQLRDAIQEPVQIHDGQISPRLVNRLLNDIGDADQLPILQHAMMRMWSEWSSPPEGGPIDLDHYQSIGELSASLSAHAEEAFLTLTESQQEVAELLFRTITETTDDQQTVRRPVEFSIICDIVSHARQENAPPDEEFRPTVEREVTSVIDKFREQGRSFLMPPTGTPLEPQTVIDISHESLIRQWDRLREWAEKEAGFTKVRRRLKGTAEEWQEKNGTDATLLYTGARLIQAEEYARDRGTTLTPLEKKFIAASSERREVERLKKITEARREARRRIQQWMFPLAVVALGVITVLAFKFSSERNKAIQQRESAFSLLKEYGWSPERLANFGENEQVIGQSIKANSRLEQDYTESRAEDRRRRTGITITYYRKEADQGRVEAVLKGLGFQLKTIDSRTENPTNVIWVNPEVIDRGNIKIEDVKAVAYALMRAGIQIKRIGPPSSGRSDWRNNPNANIWIGADESLNPMNALTVDQVQSARAFRDDEPLSRTQPRKRSSTGVFAEVQFPQPLLSSDEKKW